jgi:hypothetical protein
MHGLISGAEIFAQLPPSPLTGPRERSQPRQSHRTLRADSDGLELKFSTASKANATLYITKVARVGNAERHYNHNCLV